MRRTEQEFKAEILRRSEASRTRRRKKIKHFLVTCSCIVLLVFAQQVVSNGFGGSSAECAEDSVEYIVQNQAPAAVEEADSPAEIHAQGSHVTSGSGYYAEDFHTVCITVRTQPESDTFERRFENESQIAEIVNAIEMFRANGSLPEDNPGDSEGIGYLITVSTGTEDHLFLLFNQALFSESDGRWYDDAECYAALEKLIGQEPIE